MNTRHIALGARDVATTVRASAGIAPARGSWTLPAVGVLAAVIVTWAILGVFVDPLGSVTIVPPKLRGGEEVAEALVRFFGALVLSLYLATDERGRRMHWVASGFLFLGLGYLAFGFVEPLLVGGAGHLNEELYEGILVQVAAGALFVVALVSDNPPRLRGWSVAALLAVLGAAYIVLVKFPGGGRRSRGW